MDLRPLLSAAAVAAASLASPASAQWDPPEAAGSPVAPYRPTAQRSGAVAAGDVDQERPPIVGAIVADPARVDPGVDVRRLDANADRVILHSTAETHPQGTFFFTDYEVVFLQLGYSLTDSLQLGVTGVPPMVEDQPFFLDLSAKLNVVRAPYFRAALLGSFDLLVDGDGDTLSGVRTGAVAQLCFDGACSSSLSIGANLLVSESAGDYVPGVLHAGLAVRVSSLVSLLLEPQWGFVLGDDGGAGFDGMEGIVVGYGLRLSRASWGLDLAMLRPVGDQLDDAFILGVPFLSFTYRYDTQA